MIEIKSPVLPESVTDGVVCAWHKESGDRVMANELLAEIETDKVILEVLAPASGVVLEIVCAEGKTIGSGVLLATMRQEDDMSATPVATRQEDVSPALVTTEIIASKAVRKLLAEHNLVATDIHASGKNSRILKEDVLIHLKQLQPLQSITVNKDSKTANIRRVPMSRLRQKIAERMMHAKQNTASVTTFNEVNVTQLIALRKRFGADFEKQHGVKLGLMSFFILAAIDALRRFPVLNACIEENDVLYYNDFNIGVAVSTERGLLVPVLHAAQDMSLVDIERAILVYADAARDGTITMDSLEGGTFTVTNGGIFGSLMSTPILNSPQTGILGMHTIQDRAVVVAGAITICPMMYLALTYDHRLVDGREAVLFLKSIQTCIEHPAYLLLDLN